MTEQSNAEVIRLLRAVVVLREDVQSIARDRKWPKEVRTLAREAVSDFDSVVRMPSQDQLHALGTQAVQKES